LRVKLQQLFSGVNLAKSHELSDKVTWIEIDRRAGASKDLGGV
jgi:hypothetical protein